MIPPASFGYSRILSLLAVGARIIESTASVKLGGCPRPLEFRQRHEFPKRSYGRIDTR
jgi:hypothetical protein